MLLKHEKYQILKLHFSFKYHEIIITLWNKYLNLIPIIWFQFELEIPLNEIDTLQSANQETVSFSDFVKDQLNNIKINLKKVWNFVNGPTLDSIQVNWKNKCTMCKDCKVIKKVHPLINYIMTEWHPNLHHYFNRHICLSLQRKA